MEFRNDPLCYALLALTSSNPLYPDLKKIKQTLNNINPEIII